MIGRILLMSLAILIFFGIAERVFDRLYLSDTAALFLLGAMVIGSFFDLPLYQSETITVQMNIGGALLPLAVAVYVWVRAGSKKEKIRSLIGAFATMAGIWMLGIVVPDEFVLPVDILYLYPVLAGLLGYLFGRSRKGAFIAAVLGVLLFDMSHGIYLLWKQIPGSVQFGGGGIYDSVILSGVFAVFLAEWIGEGRERWQGGPREGRRDPSVLENLRLAGKKGGQHHG